MSLSFGEHALRLFAVAAQTLGWRPDEFWRATPAELHSALRDPHDTPCDPLNRNELTTLMEQDNG